MHLPPDVSAAVEAALAAAPKGLGEAALAARVRAAIPFGTSIDPTLPARLAAGFRASHPSNETPDYIGDFTVEDVERLTAGWRDLAWRIVPKRSLPPAVNVALDDVLAKRGAGPSLRFWMWDRPAVVLGRSQSLANEIDAEVVYDLGFTVVRRFSGGGTMFVEPDGAITYSVVLPDDALAGLSIRRSYEVCDACAVLALRSLGLDAHYVPINDIACAAGKIGGAAQARRNGMVIHHATLAYALDADAMARVLRIGRPGVRDRGVRSAAKVVAPLSLQTPLPRGAVVERLASTFRERFGGDVQPLREDELAEAEALAASKYGTPEWTADVA